MDKKLSSEFAIAVILIVAGTFAYIFWKGAMNISTDSAPTISISSENGASTKKENEGAWKIFRNDNEGYEFSLPENWKLQDESGKFVAEGEAEEISVMIEEADEDISAEKLLAQTMESDESANVQPLTEANGVKIEKVEAEVLNQTAKIIQGEDVITLTYLSRSVEQSVELFDKIIPTFKAVN
ncbi:MAG TPA: hypothetical protein DCX32_02230 [Candidatus Moranbacteria bacterium]|nr:MAG: hypothetical protein UW87_C0002G0043 [Candidatus Moranbacteria bacterium GW2011_GWC2_45_10]KKT95212.1 MAG: hypothetical protein UW95_C0003G0054 [Parcubacteria group bacterium GW2011_GWC1_45_14]HAV11338.1 hypothetical protein [Candidatus Moranbacteria bacterium]